MFSVSFGATSGVAQATVDAIQALTEQAAAAWEPYLNFNGATIEIEVEIVPIEGDTLAFGGTTFFSLGSGPFEGLFQATPILEMLSGSDPNGGQPDITISIDLETLQADEFNLNGPDQGGPVPGFFDLYTVLIHEVGHGLGFLGFGEDSDVQSVFDSFVANDGGSLEFTGPNASALNNNEAIPFADDSHIQFNNDLMSATIGPGQRQPISNVNIAILQDIGMPVLVPTENADVLQGFEFANLGSGFISGNDTIDLMGGDDTYLALSGDDIVFGGLGDDFIDGGTGANMLYGEDGDDTLINGGANSSSFGGAGDDRIILSDGFSAIVDGGLDSDTVVFMNLNAGLTLNLATNSIAVGGQARSINLISIENAAGTDFDDFLTGNNDDNTFLGGAGADAHDGGVGVDTVDYSASDQVIAMSLESNVGTLGESTGDTYVSIENIIGTAQADFITGDANANRLEGGAGNDNLNGRGGDDLVIGGDGDDSIIGFFGDDILRGGAGADDLNGGAGSDTADYSDAASRVALELYLGTGRIGDAENDTYTDIENVYGSQFNDYIVGDSGGNVLSGDLGFDNLIAAGGDDVLNGGKNGDQLDGGSGSDTASYEGSTGRVWVSLIGTSGVLNGFGFFGDAVGDTLISIENLQGTEFGDVLEGDAGDNILNGMERNDTLIGGDGNDQLIGGTGQDILQGGAGADLLDGGDGPDTVNYADATDRVAVELYINQARLNIAEGDQLISIENVVGSAFNDFIVGSGVANTIEGGAGVDFINSAGGNDIIIGGLAFDRIRTGMGNDEVRFSAGDGNDIIEDFTAGSGAGDVLSLSLGSAFDTFAEVIASASDVDGNAVLSFGSSGSITLEGVAVADLAEDDFIFPAAAVGGGATIQESIGLQMTSVGLQAEEPSELVYDESGETATVVTSEHIEGDAFLEFDVDSGIKLVCGCPSCHGLTDDAAAAAVAVQAVFIPDQTVEMRYVEGLQAFELAELDEHLV